MIMNTLPCLSMSKLQPRRIVRTASAETTIGFTIGDDDVKLTIGYAASVYEPGAIDVLELQWDDGKGHEANIEPGVLFELIAVQDSVVQACRDHFEANSDYAFGDRFRPATE